MVPRETLLTQDFFDLKDVWFSSLFSSIELPWKLLEKGRKEAWIREHMVANISHVPRNGAHVSETVFLETDAEPAVIQAGCFLAGEEIELRAGVRIEAGAWIDGPTILGKKTVVRHGAYVRGGVITGEAAVIGHATEVKSAIFLNGAKAPHFAYVGDSILGNRVNLGAGTKISNLKITNDEVVLLINGARVASGIRKMGAIVGDETETGCNSVLNPGVLLGKKCMVYPTTAVRNKYYKDGSIIK